MDKDEGILPEAAGRAEEEAQHMREWSEKETRPGPLLLQGELHINWRRSRAEASQILQPGRGY